MADEYVLKGPEVDPVPECSLGEYLLPKIRSYPQDKVLHVESATGKCQTTRQHLTLGLQVAEGLKKLGLKENDVIGMLCRNSFEASEVLLGTWFMGGAIAPVDVDMKIPELKHVFGLFKPKCVFCEEPLVAKITSALDALSMKAIIIVKNRTKGSLHPHPSFEEILVDVDVDNYKPTPLQSPSSQIAVILPSSGTSGFPKGIGLTHKNLIFQDLNLGRMYFFQDVRACLQISNFFWVTGIISYLRSMASGSKRVYISDISNVNILKAIDKYKPEWFLMAPLSLLSLTTCPEFDQFDVSSIKTIIIAGDRFSPAMAEKLKGKWGTTTMVQGYGTTEATGMFTFTPKGGDIFSAGVPIPGVRVKIVDTTTGESLKSNSIGEICFQSPGTMWGYVGDEKATREFWDSNGWCRSGDLGYYNDSGMIYIVERMKEMIKVGGFQISPAEVESVIMSLPGVVEAGVVGVYPDGFKCCLMALVVKSKKSLTEEDVASHVERTLSHYKKLTGGVHFVESLPKNVNGKLQRSQLKKLAQSLMTPEGGT